MIFWGIIWKTIKHILLTKDLIYKVFYMDDRELLKKIVKEYDILNDAKLFKALISDYFYDKRVVKNLLYVSYDEGIPHAISKMSDYSKIEEGRFVKMLIDAYACDESIAKEIVSLWMYAYNVDPFSDLITILSKLNNTLEEYQDIDDSLKSNPIEVLQIGVRTETLLHNNNIDTLRDLLCYSPKQLMSVKGIGQKNCDNISLKLQDYGGWKLTDESSNHFEKFYSCSSKKIIETKGCNWVWNFYVNSMLKIYEWIDKYKKMYKIYAFETIEKNVEKRSLIEEVSFSINTFINVIEIYNNSGVAKAFTASPSENEVLHYIETIYLFYKKLVMTEAEVNIVYYYFCREKVVSIILQLFDGVFKDIENHKKCLETYKHELDDFAYEVPIEDLALKITLDEEVLSNLKSEIMKMK